MCINVKHTVMYPHSLIDSDLHDKSNKIIQQYKNENTLIVINKRTTGYYAYYRKLIAVRTFGICCILWQGKLPQPHSVAECMTNCRNHQSINQSGIA